MSFKLYIFDTHRVPLVTTYACMFFPTNHCTLFYLMRCKIRLARPLFATTLIRVQAKHANILLLFGLLSPVNTVQSGRAGRSNVITYTRRRRTRGVCVPRGQIRSLVLAPQTENDIGITAYITTNTFTKKHLFKRYHST